MARKSKVDIAQMMAEEELGHSFMFDSEPEARELQIVATDIFYRNQAATAGIVINRGGRGSGKCFVPGTEILMADNSLKKIEDIEVGDEVLGIDFKPKKVLEVHSGHGPLYRVDQTKGMSYTVNGDHLLVLKRFDTNDTRHKHKNLGDVITVPTKDFSSKSKNFKKTFGGFKKVQEFPHKEVSIMSRITVTYVGEGDYIGFSLGRDSKFFLKDFTVVHNSHALAQLMLYKFFNEERKKILILRKSLPSLRLSTYKLMTDLAAEYGVYDRIVVEKVHLNWYYNGSMVHFGSVDESSKIKCFHPDTDILTKDGWKKVSKVVEGEEVATMNPLTRKMFYKPVTQCFSYDYDGFLYTPSSEKDEIKTTIDFAVTPDHKMLVVGANGGLSFQTAEDCAKKRYVKFARYVDSCDQGEYQEFFEIPSFDNGQYRKKRKKPTIFPMVSFLKFLGWYLSEGCSYWYEKRGQGGVIISQTKPEGREKFKKDMEDFPYDYHEQKDRFVFLGKDLAIYFRKFGKCKDKFIPREILNLHPSLLRHLFDCLIAGDGFWCKDHKKGSDYRWCYSTISEQLAQDVMELGVKLGYAVRGFVSVNSYGNRSWLIKGFKKRDSGVHHLKQIPYVGKVYCMEVPPFNTIVSKYSQVVVITGNSSNWNYLFIEEATEINYDEFQDLRFCIREPSRDGLRNQIYLAFNPIDAFHWIKEKLIDDSTVNTEEIVSCYKDNPFLPDDYVQMLLDLETQDASLYNIFTLGNWGRLDNLIYRNWDTCKWIPDDDQVDHVVYGLDFGYNCVDEETEILTKSGWKKHYELKVGDFALTFNKEMVLSEWQVVENVSRYEGSHTMIGMSNRSHSSLTTYNHNWLIKNRSNSFKFKTTKEIKCNDMVVCAAKCNNLPVNKTYSDSFVELVAWFWTEGQITSGGISLWQKEGEEACRIRSALIAEFGEELVNTRNGKHRAPSGWIERPLCRGSICHFAINLNGAEKLLIVAPNKVVTPEFISLLTEDQLRLFIEVSILADGHVSKKGNTSIGQSKSERLDALQMAASLLGIWANLSVDLQPDCPSYKGKVVKHSSLCLHKYGGGDLLIGAIKQKKEFYEGVVWCPTTQNKTWLARRKGKIYFTGNSPTALIKTSIKKPADVWEEELLYHHELTNADLIVKLKDIIPEGRRRSSIIWADSERPDCIKEINQAGFNCKPAIKQIKAGIDIVKRMNCHILETSLNIIKEKRAYSWKKDKRGDLTDEPVGWMDHLMDAERYAVHSTVAKLGTGFRLRFI